MERKETITERGNGSCLKMAHCGVRKSQVSLGHPDSFQGKIKRRKRKTKKAAAKFTILEH